MVGNVFAIYFKTNIQNFFVLVYFVCHTPQFKMLVFAFQSEIWIAENFNFSVFEVFCLSLSWKYRFAQNVNHPKVQSKTNKYCKFHFDLTRKGLSKSRFKMLGMQVPKKLYRNTLSGHNIEQKSSFVPGSCQKFISPQKKKRGQISTRYVKSTSLFFKYLSVRFLWVLKIRQFIAEIFSQAAHSVAPC